METSDWPPSNYPIFLALVLLAATAVTLAMGDEPRAEELAIYAYYLLVIGVTIRFFELALPDNTPQRIGSAKRRVLRWVDKRSPRINKYPSKDVISNITYKLHLPCKESIAEIETKMNQTIKKSHLVYIQDVSKDVSIYLLVLFLILSFYGFMFGWWIVRGYLEELALIIIGFFAMYLLLSIILRQSQSRRT